MEWPFKKALKEAIKENRIFNGADDNQVKAIMTHGTRKNVVKNEFILNEGQDTSALFLVVDGKLEVKLPVSTSDSFTRRVSGIKLNTLKPGDCFGEYSLIDRQLVSASVQSVTDGILFVISDREFHAITQSDERLACLIYKNLLEVLVGRLRKKDRELDDVLIMN